MLGLYPIVTQPIYLLGSPWFDDINITVNGNKTLRIKSNGNPQSLGQMEFFVKSVHINGQRWSKNWFDHDQVMTQGGLIEFEVSGKELIWESGEVPPSPGHVEGEAETSKTRETPAKTSWHGFKQWLVNQAR